MSNNPNMNSFTFMDNTVNDMGLIGGNSSSNSLFFPASNPIDTSSFITLDNSATAAYNTTTSQDGVDDAGCLFDLGLSQATEIKEELIDDFNILELLQEDPDMLRLLESVNGDPSTLLPQISVNSASRVLESIDQLATVGDNSFSSSNIQKNSSFKNLCDLLSINPNSTSFPNLISLKDETEPDLTAHLGGTEIKTLPPTPPLSPPPSMLQPASNTRVSMRLINKKSDNSSSNVVSKPPVTKKTSLKRKRDCLSEENSMTNFSETSEDYIYYDDDDDEDDDDEYDEDMKSNSGGSLDEAIVTKKQRSRSSRRQAVDQALSLLEGGDPSVKKESNKEAATRYRLKKLSEKDKMFETRVRLEKDNDQVKKRIELVQTEINYLKNLLVQMILAKGVLNNNSASSSSMFRL